MKKTLMAVGIAVLVSMMFTPHRFSWGTDPGAFRHFPIFLTDPWAWAAPGNPILWGQFIGQTAFVAVLAAVLVNLRRTQ